jgi:dGTPase
VRILQPKIADSVGVDPDTTEAAALAHDLGHPPFGHLAEEALDELATRAGLEDGFDGNAQSFRIVTRLALRSRDSNGLNLTRATLNAILKYPWLRGKGPYKDKWGAYETEREYFLWARSGDISDQRKAVEAEIMDWADDVTYAVHDMSDFFRAGLIPLDRLASRHDDSARQRFFEEVFKRDGDKLTRDFSSSELKERFTDIVTLFPFDQPYAGTNEHRARLRQQSSGLIGTYVAALQLREPKDASDRTVTIDPAARNEVAMLKQLTWHYVILNPSLATQQYGQRRLVQALFGSLRDAAIQDNHTVFPYAIRDELSKKPAKEGVTRLVVDYIASMTERQAHSLFLKLTGSSPGSAIH